LIQNRRKKLKTASENINKNLYICQSLPTIQGEGSKSGEPSYLIRLAYCNLKCPWCDSKYSWKYKKELPGSTVVNEKNFDYWIDDVNMLCQNDYGRGGEVEGHNIQNVMITGGEPLLYMNNYWFLEMLAQLAVETIEIETNGILIDKLYNYYINAPTFHERQHCTPRKANLKLNISPKIDPRCYSSKKEFETSIDKIKENIEKIKDIHECELKFVHDPRLFDCDSDFEDFIGEFNLPESQFIIMPLTPFKLKDTSHAEYMYYYVKDCCTPTIQFCMKYGYKFSPRIHTFLFEDHLEDLGEDQ
jgi:organic radical activating enzyme